ncbi:hypothetical protein REPUB_Repub06bG0014500 [Reevesia pubescens]
MNCFLRKASFSSSRSSIIRVIAIGAVGSGLFYCNANPDSKTTVKLSFPSLLHEHLSFQGRPSFVSSDHCQFVGPAPAGDIPKGAPVAIADVVKPSCGCLGEHIKALNLDVKFFPFDKLKPFSFRSPPFSFLIMSSSDETTVPQPDPDASPGLNRTQTQIPPTIHQLFFNQDNTCFYAATDRGFLVFNTDPYRPLLRRDFDTGLSLLSMLFRFEVFALVGSSPSASGNTNTKALLWDDHASRCVGELSFRSPIRSIRLRRDTIIVTLLHKIYVYNFSDLKLLHQLETTWNPKGVCEVSQVSGPMVLVCPGLQKGTVRIENCGSKRSKFINAHSSNITCLALTHDGRVLATASSKGTLIRVFNALDGTLIQEV